MLNKAYPKTKLQQYTTKTTKRLSIKQTQRRRPENYERSWERNNNEKWKANIKKASTMATEES